MTPVSRIRLYIATSVDGYIARADGGVKWLDPYFGEEYGFNTFFDSVSTIVMGRTTFDHSKGYGADSYQGKHVIVVSNRSLDEDTDLVECWSQGIPALIERLRHSPGDTWLMGGGRLLASFLAEDAVDELEIYVIPLLLGDGIPLFPVSGHHVDLQFKEGRDFESGVQMLRYAPRRPA